MKYVRMGFRHRLSGEIKPLEFREALLNGPSFADYMRGWCYARQLFPN